MKRIFIALLVLLLLTGIGAAAQQTGVPAADAASPVLDLLSLLPASAFNDGWLSIVDFTVLVANRPGAVWPDGIEAYGRMEDEGEGAAVLSAYTGVSAGPGDFYQKLNLRREMYEASGIDYFRVRQAAEAGMPPRRQIWLAGAFDVEAIAEKLKAKEYQLLPDTASGFEIWCRDGDPAGGMKINLKDRDPAFPFGGNLGQSWPVMLSETLIGATPDGNAVIGIANGSAASLADLAFLKELAGAVPRVREGEEGSIAQLYLLTLPAAGLDLPAPPDIALLQDPEAIDRIAEERGSPLPFYPALALAHVYTADAQWVAVALPYGSEALAEAAASEIEKRLGEALLRQTGERFLDRIHDMGGSAGPFRTLTGEAGMSVLILPFRFPAEGSSGKADAAPNPASGLPFRLFVRALLSRDLGWLTVGFWK